MDVLMPQQAARHKIVKTFPALSHLLSRAVHLLIQRCQSRKLGIDLPAGATFTLGRLARQNLRRLNPPKQGVHSMEVACARCIGLNLELSSIVWESLQQLTCHLHVRQLIWICTSRDGDVPLSSTARKEQGAGKLGAVLNTHRDGAAHRPFSKEQRWQFVVGCVHPVAQLSQGFDQLLLRTLMHAWNARNSIHTMAQADHRRQKACGRPGVRHEELQRRGLRAALGELTVASLDGDDAVGIQLRVHGHVHLDAQAFHAIHHGLCVFAPQGTFQNDFSLAQRRQHDGAICNAFGSRHHDLRLFPLEASQLFL
mmetsp:Transcript_18319/g.30996  ORF Transcript_18319/g.30996 Transcript_18319/m.30996 type:complete len:311 (+) Transcript_18319:525-1457(+)